MHVDPVLARIISVDEQKTLSTVFNELLDER